jgi:hypothetical protein
VVCNAGSTLMTVVRASILTIWVCLAEDPAALYRSRPEEYAKLDQLRQSFPEGTVF